MSSISKDKLLLTYDDLSLLKHSYLITQYPSLENLISKKNNIHETDLDYLDADTRNILKYQIKTFKESLHGEWVAVKDGSHLYRVDLEEGYEHCEVCNASDNRYLYFIKNKRTDKELHVGSRCIFNYIDIGVSGKLKAEYLNNEDRSYKKMRNTAQFNKNCPNAIGIVNSWDDYYRSLKIKLPTFLDKEYIKCYQSARKIIKKVQENDVTTSLEMSFNKLLSEFEKIKVKINEYIISNEDNKFILTTKVCKWLLDRNENKLYRKLCQSGLIGKDDIKYIYEEEFLLQFIPIYKDMLKSSGIINIECDFEKNRMILTYLMKKIEIKVYCHMSKLLDKYSGLIFNKHLRYSITDFIKECSFYLEGLNVGSFLNIVEDCLDKNNAYIDFFDIQHNIMCLNYGNRYKKLPLDGMLNIFKNFIIDSYFEKQRLELPKDFICKMVNNENWICFDDYKELMKNYMDKETHQDFFDKKKREYRDRK